MLRIGLTVMCASCLLPSAVCGMTGAASWPGLVACGRLNAGQRSASARCTAQAAWMCDARLHLAGTPRSTRPRGRAVWRYLLAGVSDGCFFLMSVSDDYSFSIDDRRSGRPPFIQISSVLSVLSLEG
jgi:hypothetical protein